MSIELWLPLKIYPLYEVSNKANVRSLKFNKVKEIRPHLVGNRYNITLSVDGKQTTIRRAILVAMAFHNHIPCGMLRVVDHKDENKLNDIPSNLQIITQKENVVRSKKNKTSVYEGVSWYSRISKWKATIRINGKQKGLGYYLKELDAHRAYKKAKKKLVNSST